MNPFLLGLSGFPGSSPGSVVVVGLRETDPVEDVLESMLEMSGAGELVEDQKVAGRWMTSVLSPDLQLQPSWAFLDDALVFSLQAEPVRAVLAQAAEAAPPSWLEDEGHREALAGGDAAFGVSVASLEPFLQAEVVQPLAWLASFFAGGNPSPGEPQPEEVAVQIVEALPELVAEHLRGTLRASMTIEGRVLSYRVWTR